LTQQAIVFTTHSAWHFSECCVVQILTANVLVVAIITILVIKMRFWLFRYFLKHGIISSRLIWPIETV
jgi:hypothetical protein